MHGESMWIERELLYLLLFLLSSGCTSPGHGDLLAPWFCVIVPSRFAQEQHRSDPALGDSAMGGKRSGVC